jgi:hypothetical protein
MTKRLFAMLLALIMSVASVSATAGWLSDAYNAAGAGGNITPGGSYQTAQGRGWSGGSASWRVPNRSVPLLQATAPSLASGCSGIDWHAGAFQFVNIDKLIDTLRNLGQNALGYFFSLALKTMAPEVSQTLDYIQDQVNKINGLMIGGCRQAQWMVDSMGGNWMKENQRKSIFEQRDSGAATDNWEADAKSPLRTATEVIGDAFKQCTKETTATDPLCEEPEGVNYIYWAMALMYGPNKKPSAFTPDAEQKMVIHLLMSYYSSFSRDDQGNFFPVGGHLEFESLFNGDGTGKFKTGSCKAADPRCVLFDGGDVEEVSARESLLSAMNAISDGVVGYSAVALTPFQQRLITASSYPLYRAAQLSRNYNEELATAGAAEAAYNVLRYYTPILLRGLDRMQLKLGETSRTSVKFTIERIREKMRDTDLTYRRIVKRVGTPTETITQLEMIEKGTYLHLGRALAANAKFRSR